jgi:hypothetical protein
MRTASGKGLGMVGNGGLVMAVMVREKSRMPLRVKAWEWLVMADW